MKLEEIKQVVTNGQTVYWSNKSYVVTCDTKGDYYIKCVPNGHLMGLTWQDGVTMNGDESEFFTDQPQPMTPNVASATYVALEPIFENVKSYYGKAKCFRASPHEVALISYDTLVATFDTGSNTLRIMGYYSSTTLRHIREFAQQRGLPKMSKQELYKYVVKGGSVL